MNETFSSGGNIATVTRLEYTYPMGRKIASHDIYAVPTKFGFNKLGVNFNWFKASFRKHGVCLSFGKTFFAISWSIKKHHGVEDLRDVYELINGAMVLTNR